MPTSPSQYAESVLNKTLLHLSAIEEGTAFSFQWPLCRELQPGIKIHCFCLQFNCLLLDGYYKHDILQCVKLVKFHLFVCTCGTMRFARLQGLSLVRVREHATLPNSSTTSWMCYGTGFPRATPWQRSYTLFHTIFHQTAILRYDAASIQPCFVMIAVF